MTLWFVLTIMTSVAAVLVSAPFIRRMERRRLNSSGDVAIYVDQLKEIEAEKAIGLIDAAQAESAMSEIKRRLLAADKSVDAASTALSSRERTLAAIGVSGIVVFGSIGLFALTANLEPPPAQSVASMGRFVADSGQSPAPQAVTAPPPVASAPQLVPGKTRAQAQSTLPPVEELVQRLVARLQRNPKDTEGWRMLGWSYFSTEHFVEAAAAYARAIELNPTVASHQSARAEALIKAANGVVTNEAKKSLDEALRLDPKDSRARFFNGLAEEQAGDKAAALKDWTELLSAIDLTEPWAAELKQRTSDLAKQLEGGPGQSSSPSGPATGTGAAAEAPKTVATPSIDQKESGPRPEDIKRAEAMPPSDREAMIRGMVDGLANRLEQSPHDAEGWIKLIRSQSVLGETEKAKQALERALKAFDDDPTERKRIAEAAQQLGLSP
jgi:cytochrome c-type biogenesis protein CcmH